jgi:SAM-dependent methyltransferase
VNIQESWWAGESGDEYLKRNRVDWRARIPFWHDILKFTGARSVYEVGCNAGWNLSAIQEVARAKLYGCEINQRAASQAVLAGLSGVECGDAERCMGGAELIFTAGVLIHVAPTDLPKLLRLIVKCSGHWILAIEYAADVEEMIEYRGQSQLLWKRPYGKLYEALGLKVLHTGEATGFDRCTYWLMEKP